MAINAVPLGCNSPITQDIRNAQSASPAGGLNIAQAEMDSGRAIQLANSTQGRPRQYADFEDSGVLANGDSLYVAWEFIDNISAADDVFAGGVQGDRFAGWQGYDAAPSNPNVCAVRLVLDVAGHVAINVWDANATRGLGSSGTVFALSRVGSPYIKDWLGLKITLDSSTQMTITAYKNGVPATPYVYTNAGGVGTISFQTFRFGMGAALAKGASCDLRLGNWFVSGTPLLANGQEHIAFSLPTGDGATNEWVKLSGGAASYTEVDDAFGSYSTVDGNTTGSVTAQKTTIETFPALSLPSDYVIELVGLNAASGLNGSAIDTNRMLGVATSSALTGNTEKDMTLGKAALEVNGAQIRYFATRGDGTPWTPATVDADTIYVRKLAVGAANEWQVYALGQMVWYRMPAINPRQRRRSGPQEPEEMPRPRRPFLASAAAVVSSMRRRMAQWF